MYTIMQLGNYAEAAKYYKKAAASNANDFSTPLFLFKSGMALEKAEDYKAAIESYKQIEQEFPTSVEAREIEKYIKRAELSAKK